MARGVEDRDGALVETAPERARATATGAVQVAPPAGHAAPATGTPAAGHGAGSRAPAGEPDSPAELDKRSWLGVLKRTIREFKEDDLTDWAAALT